MLANITEVFPNYYNKIGETVGSGNVCGNSRGSEGLIWVMRRMG